DVKAIAGLIARSSRPVLVLGSDVWLGGAETAAREAACELRLPVVANGQGRGVLPAGHELLVTRARSAAFGEADLVLVAGAAPGGAAAGLRARLGRLGRRGGPRSGAGDPRGRQRRSPRPPRPARRLRRRGPGRVLHGPGQRRSRGDAASGHRGPAVGGQLAPP